ncbi:hypothetical protein ACFQ1Q_05770 [Winogradskyella litorisediminis]|uniref:Uncharacterized protein n=1 Tax=Winogradskyella litorisediminis TaxID=1156618 RepID=A0ABW3N4W4_9FLAO
MKIEFEVDRSEAIVLLEGLKHLMGITNNPATIKTLHKIIAEIQRDGKLNDIVFKNLEYHTRDYRNMNFPFKIDSDLRNDLKMSNPFISSTYGLKQRCQIVLKHLVLKGKPGTIIPKMSLTKVKKCKKVSEVVNLIVDKYEAA